MKRVDRRHPSDERLVSRYFEPSDHDEALELHLVRCPGCAARAGHLAAVLDSDQDRTLAAADASFGTERLARQRAAILDRIARPAGAGVLAFRGRRLGAPVAARVVRNSRWAAAAAVLVFSVSLGGSWVGGRWASPAADRYADVRMQAALTATHELEDALLLEIDRALSEPRTRELRAIDALTPRADELVEF